MSPRPNYLCLRKPWAEGQYSLMQEELNNVYRTNESRVEIGEKK